MDPNTQDPDTAPLYEEQVPQMDVEEGVEEPLGTQVLRRVHQDCQILLEEYDDMCALLEHPKVKKFLLKRLQRFAEDLEEIEGLFQEFYTEQSPLEGGMQEDIPPVEGMGDEPLPVDGSMPPVDENAEGKDINDASTDSVEADSNELPVPSLQGAVDGMKRPRPQGQKSYPVKSKDDAKYGPQGSRRPVQARTDAGVPEHLPENQRGPELYGARGAGAAVMGKRDIPGNKAMDPTFSPSQEAPTSPSGDYGMHPYSKELDDEEKKKVNDAMSFLDQISQDGSDFRELEKMKSFHFHKSLEEISGMGEMGGMMGEKANPSKGNAFRPTTGTFRPEIGIADTGYSNESGQGTTSYRSDVTGDVTLTNRPATSDNPGLEGMDTVIGRVQDRTKKKAMGEDMGMMTKDPSSVHPHRQACAATSEFLKSLAFVKAFGDPHRQECLIHKDLLAPVFSEMKEQANIGGGKLDLDHTVTGELGEKMTKAESRDREATIREGETMTDKRVKEDRDRRQQERIQSQVTAPNWQEAHARDYERAARNESDPNNRDANSYMAEAHQGEANQVRSQGTTGDPSWDRLSQENYELLRQKHGKSLPEQDDKSLVAELVKSLTQQESQIDILTKKLQKIKV